MDRAGGSNVAQANNCCGEPQASAASEQFPNGRSPFFSRASRPINDRAPRVRDGRAHPLQYLRRLFDALPRNVRIDIAAAEQNRRAGETAGIVARRAGEKLLHATAAGRRLELCLRLREVIARRHELLLEGLHLRDELRDRGYVDHRKLRMRRR